MNIYLVGGAVRDQLLNLPVTDKDWVVVGSTPEHMIQQGFIQVGKDFPVFLHPKTKEEYALARTERKLGKGYTGFICDFNEHITLEQDLLRRDLTINAIAMDQQQQIIDPFHGVSDLKQRLLRHVSPAFSEDPLRVLRVARFAARFHHLGFTIAPETLLLMQQIVTEGEMQNLTAERVWKETEKALHSQSPEIYFDVLKACGALDALFPELATLFGRLGENKLDLGTQSLLALKRASELTDEINIRFAALCVHFLDEQQIKQLCHHIKVPNHAKELAVIAHRHCKTVYHINQLTAEQIVLFFNRIDIWRKPERLNQLIVCCVANLAPQITIDSYPQALYLKHVYKLCNAVSVKEIIAAGFQGKSIQEKLQQLRIQVVYEWQATHD